MPDTRPRPSRRLRADGGHENEPTPEEMTQEEKRIARGRQVYENVGSFRDVFKIVLIVVVLIAIVIVFFL